MKKETRVRNKLSLLESFGYACFRCGLEATVENLPIWQFHHIDKYSKKWNVGTIINSAESTFEGNKQEIKETCVMMCSNCHDMVTAMKYERNKIYYKWLEKKERTQRMFDKIKQVGLME